MELADVGRDEPCPCGSGRKYKGCCLAVRDAVMGNDAALAAEVDRAIEEDDWEPPYGRVDAGMRLFERGAPLEHVRFWDGDVRSRTPDRAELAQLCTAGWLKRCELEIAYVLNRYRLKEEERDGLRLAGYLLRRFGAQSPTVEEIATLQAAEHVLRVRRMANAVSAQGLTLDEVMAGGGDLVDWIERARPTVLSFAEWLALRTMPKESFSELWFSGIATRVCEVCLERLEDPKVADRRMWLDLAAATLLVQMPIIGRVLAYETSPRLVTADERTACEALAASGVALDVLDRIAWETEAREDFAGAALLRAVMHSSPTGLRSID
jgi:hypothetical protein